MIDPRQLTLPEIASGDAAPTIDSESQTGMPPLDWGEDQPMSAEEKARTQAEWTAIKMRVKDAKPKDLTVAERFARNIARKEEREAKKRSDKEAVAVVALKPSKRAAKAKGSATAAQGADKPAKSASSPRKRQAKIAAVPTVRLPEVVQAPMADSMPPITQEAISFLARQDVKPADLFKLSPASLEFVRYHFDFVERIETNNRESAAHLMAISPFSLQGRAKSSPVPEPVAATVLTDAQVATKAPPDYSSKPSETHMYAPSDIKLRTLEISSNLVKDEVHVPELPEDLARAKKVVATAQIMMSAPIDDLTPRVAADMVAGDLADMQAIKGENARRMALVAMADSSHSQPRYRVEFERQAPELVVEADKVHMAKDRSMPSDIEKSTKPTSAHKASVNQPVLAEAGPNTLKDPEVQLAQLRDEIGQVEDPSIENSIEPSPVQVVSVQHQTAPVDAVQRPRADTVAQPVTAPVQRPGAGTSLLAAAGDLARKARIWLADRASGSAPSVADDRPPARSAEDSAKSSAPEQTVEDKSSVIPDAVARRFLKVEQDYYFPDKAPAFSDRGNKLATRGADPEVVRALVEIAQARGWDSITVKGTEQFRRATWMEAAQNGLKVVGYQPTPLDLAVMFQ